MGNQWPPGCWLVNLLITGFWLAVTSWDFVPPWQKLTTQLVLVAYIGGRDEQGLPAVNGFVKSVCPET